MSRPDFDAEPVDPAERSQAAVGGATLNRRRSLILGAVGLAILVLIFVRVIPQVGSYADAAVALRAMTPWAVLVIAATVVLYLGVYGLPFMAATPGLAFWRSQQVNQAAFTLGNGLPAGGAFAVGVQYAMLTGYGTTLAVATAAITAVGVWSVFVTLGVPVLGVGAIQMSGHASGAYLLPAAVGLGVLMAAIVGFALVMRSESLARALGRAGNQVVHLGLRLLRRPKVVDLVPAVVGFRASVVALVRRRWAAITAAQLAVSFAQFLILFAALRGVQGWSGAGTSVLVAFGAFAVAQLGLMIPVTPGGLGTVDAAMIAMLTNMGVPAGQATAADLVWRAASFVPQIVVGLVALIAWSHGASRRVGARRHPG